MDFTNAIKFDVTIKQYSKSVKLSVRDGIDINPKDFKKTE